MFVQKNVEQKLTDATIEHFTQYMKKYPELYENIANIIHHYTSLSRPLIIDVGAGPGLLAYEILNKKQDSIVVGIDPSKKMLQMALQNTQNIQFFPAICISEQLCIKQESADAIVSRFSLPYWKNPKKSFAEIYRVLKPGGYIILECLNKQFPRWRLNMVRLHMFLNAAKHDVITYHIDAYNRAYTKDDVTQMLTNVGFSIIETLGKRYEWRFIIIGKK